MARLAGNFAGVAVADDSRNDIVIRGNSPTGVLWQLEGIPTEPYAFSNNPAVKWRRPRYGEVSFPVESSETTLQLTMSRWSDR